MQRLQTHVSGIVRAVRVRDDARRLERAVRPFTSGTTSGIAVPSRYAPTCRRRARRRATAWGTSSREAVVPTEKSARSRSPARERLGRRLLDRDARRARVPRRARRGERAHVRRSRARAGAAASPSRRRRSRRRRRCARLTQSPSSNASCSAATAFGTSPVATWQAILIGDVEMTFDVDADLARASRTSSPRCRDGSSCRRRRARPCRGRRASTTRRRAPREQLLARGAILERRAEDDLAGRSPGGSCRR